ncbi:gamma-glutamylcyclotransferase [Leptolyngbya sp. FACHB-36]|uniref:gamma-glutamylcyclotransferase family protein n=1 Tax=Leptolyngbya sp. FACHB-36 TaxID=2692808 RepID=UPI00322008CB
MVINLFVYGTLKPSEARYAQHASEIVAASRAIALGQLYALPLGYPAMTAGTMTVHGYVLSFADDCVLNQLDEYELHDPAEFERYAGLSRAEHEYDRVQIATFDPAQTPLGTAWAYTMTTKQVQRLRGLLLPEGHWSREHQAQLFSALDL